VDDAARQLRPSHQDPSQRAARSHHQAGPTEAEVVWRRDLPAVAVVLAGGTGSRVGLDLPKQLLKVAGKPILAHTLELLDSSDVIDEVVLLMAPGWLDEAKDIVASGRLSKVRIVREGGGTRSDTTRIALSTLFELGLEECKVLFHDAVRPLLDHRIVADCVSALDHFDAVDVAIPSADTIIVVDGPASRTGDGAIIKDIPNRARLMRGQTPQAFLLTTINAAYALAAEDPAFRATDDCSVVSSYLPDVPIYVVTGSEQNMKVTYPIDVFLADQLFRLGSTHPAHSFDEQTTRAMLDGKVLVIFGASSGIGAELAELAEIRGATVVSLSRSGTGLHIEDPRACENALSAAHAEHGRIDYVVVTAGVLHMTDLSLADDDVIGEAVGVNLLGPIYAARAAHQYLKGSGGRLLLFTSSSYTRGRSGYSLYSATKAAVVNLTQALADEWSVDGILVNCINPERTATPMRTKAFGNEHPGSLLSAGAVAQASLDVLLSEQTGNVIDVRRDPDGMTRSPSITEALDEIEAAAQEARAAD
jgi:2-C-methyl-D-erythritol 4-phosphate cytidylyltransferase